MMHEKALVKVPTHFHKIGFFFYFFLKSQNRIWFYRNCNWDKNIIITSKNKKQTNNKNKNQEK